MEEIAIHIKNYKNIKNQTFCFNPEFNCKYFENKEDFEFTKKENYINIFPKNINITAIVGKNGTGKSGILKAFLERLKSEDENFNIYEKNKYKNNFMTIYWDYSITDESFINVYPTKNNNMHDTNDRIVLIPSKVDDNFKSKIDIIEDIQNLTKSILSLDHIEEIVSDFFKIQKVIIATKTEQNDLKHINLQYFQDYYDCKEKFFCYEVDIKNKNEIMKLIHENDTFIDFVSKDGKKLLDLSFGEIQLLKILYNIQNIISKETKCNNNILFLLDEIELGLHPQWQKMIINLLSKISIENDKKVYFVLTSHSPFILSDLPKENIIFLEKYDEKNKKELEKKYPKLNLNGLENGNCINISEYTELKTFGANIHTLLSNGFFMSDGLMGEFAKSKIKEIKKFYDKNKELKKDDSKFQEEKERFGKDKEHFRNIQKIIGEQFLQTIIKNYIDELEILFNGKKEFLDKEIKRLEELRNEIK